MRGGVEVRFLPFVFGNPSGRGVRGKFLGTLRGGEFVRGHSCPKVDENLWGQGCHRGSNWGSMGF